MATNPNQSTIDALNAIIKNLDAAEAQLEAGVATYEKNLKDSCDSAAAATKAAVDGLNAQKATYEAQEAALRAAVTALGG